MRNEPFGMLKLTVWIRNSPHGESGKYHLSRLTLLREYCRREEAEDKIKAFRALNPQFCDGLEAFWQAEPERLNVD